MIDRPDLVDILTYKNPGLQIALSKNVDTGLWEIFDNPSNFSMPDDDTLNQWAADYDAHLTALQQVNVTVRDRIVGIVGTTDQEKQVATDMLNKLLNIEE